MRTTSLSRGQEIAGIDETKAEHGPLKPGQMSFHHGRTFHASSPNNSDDRRIGLAIRYVTPGVFVSRHRAAITRCLYAARTPKTAGSISLAPIDCLIPKTSRSIVKSLIINLPLWPPGPKGNVDMYQAEGAS